MGGNVLASPAVASWGPRHLNVVAVGPDQALYHKAFDGAHWRPSLVEYTRLGGKVRY